jgi:hypothetical protein
VIGLKSRPRNEVWGDLVPTGDGMQKPRVNLSRSCRSRFGLTFLFIFVALLLSNCAGKRLPGTEKIKPSESVAAMPAKCRRIEEENQRLKETVTDQAAAYQELEGKVARLELRLMKEEIETEGPADREALLEKKLDEAIQEVVRAKAKLRSLESRAEAASNMAEAEVALKDLKTRLSGQEKHLEVSQAEYLLEMSTQEFKRENYSGALYLTSQAKSLVKMGQDRLTHQDRPPKRPDPVVFVVPLRLQVLKRSNIREGPGLEFPVLCTVEKGSSVTGYSYQGEWVQVKSEDDREGWVFHALVTGDEVDS